MAHRVAHKIPLPAKPAWPAPPQESLEDVLRERWGDRLGHTRELVRNPAPLACEPGRWDVPEQLPGTGMISGYPELDGAETIVRLLRATLWLYRPLRDAVAGLAKGKRGPSGWLDAWRAPSSAGWTRLRPTSNPGTETPPTSSGALAASQNGQPTQTIQRRFVELEDIATVFAGTLDRLVQHARKREPRIGQAIVVDGTMVESNARPHRLANLTDPIRGLGKLPVLASQRMPTTGVDDIRRAVNAAPLDSGSMRVGEWIDVTERVSRGALGNYRVLVTSNGVPYASLDPDAGEWPVLARCGE